MQNTLEDLVPVVALMSFRDYVLPRLAVLWEYRRALLWPVTTTCMTRCMAVFGAISIVLLALLDIGVTSIPTWLVAAAKEPRGPV